MPIKYPYLPEGKKIKYVPETNRFMREARRMAERSGCSKQSTGAVLVKGGEIIGRGVNAGLKVAACPRVLRGSKTGEDYDLCKNICDQESHSEVMAVRSAQKKGTDTAGADLYLYGHWWCCRNCWDTMNAGKIKSVFLLKGSEKKFNFSSKIGKIYISGALTHANERNRKNYEKIAGLCSSVCSNIYVPHLRGTDPKKNKELSPEAVWRRDHHEVASSDLIIAYVGKPALGVGAELEIARITDSKIILWWFKGENVSRMARGNPAASYMIEAKNEKDLYKKLEGILSQI